MGFTYGYPVGAAAESFVRGDVLGWDGVTGTVRLIQSGDVFAGFVADSKDRTGKPVAQMTHAVKFPRGTTLAVQVGRLRIAAKAAVTTVHGQACYAATVNTFSHTSADGPFIGYLQEPWFDHPNFWYVDTQAAYLRVVPVELA